MPAVNDSKYVVTGGWDSVPHLDEKTKAEMEANTPPHLRGARMRGEPSLGAGAVYPVSPDDFRVAPFVIPGYFRRGYGLDVGWNKTAAVWGAHDIENDILYLISEHYQGERPPSVHADAIKARGAWQPGFIDPASQGASQRDGKRLIDDYRAKDLNLRPAENAVEAGVMEVYQRLASGRMKVFSTLTNWFEEYRFYIRDEKNGKIVKKNDHCLHPDTIVITDSGPSAIKSLVGTEGRVLSVGGVYQPYRNCRMTAENQKIVKVTFSDGSVVRCTPDHLFLTDKGWVEAIDLEGLRCYNAVTHSIKRQYPCVSGSYLKPSKSLRASATGFAVNISSAMADAFTLLCGLMRTAWSRLRATMSTIATVIDQTITRTTWNCSTLPNTFHTTTRACPSQWTPRRWSRPLSGTAPMRAVNGTGSITRGRQQNSTPSGTSLASSVAWASARKTLEQTGFAQTGAKQGIASSLASIMSRGNALFARLISQSTNTVRQKPAGQPALVSCLEVSDAGYSDVYCLTVPSTAAFAVEGGVVVHNCMDATRYLAMSIPQMITKPAAQSGAMIAPTRALDTRAGY